MNRMGQLTNLNIRPNATFPYSNEGCACSRIQSNAASRIGLSESGRIDTSWRKAGIPRHRHGHPRRHARRAISWSCSYGKLDTPNSRDHPREDVGEEVRIGVGAVDRQLNCSVLVLEDHSAAESVLPRVPLFATWLLSSFGSCIRTM